MPVCLVRASFDPLFVRIGTACAQASPGRHKTTMRAPGSPLREETESVRPTDVAQLETYGMESGRVRITRWRAVALGGRRMERDGMSVRPRNNVAQRRCDTTHGTVVRSCRNNPQKHGHTYLVGTTSGERTMTRCIAKLESDARPWVGRLSGGQVGSRCGTAQGLGDIERNRRGTPTMSCKSYKYHRIRAILVKRPGKF